MKVNQTSKKVPWSQKASDKLGKIICCSYQKGRILLLYAKLLEIEEEKTVNLIEKDGQETRMRGPQMTLKHMQKWSTAFKIGEIQIKTTPGYSDLPDRLAKIQHTLLVNSWWNKTFSSIVAETAESSGSSKHRLWNFQIQLPSLPHLASRNPSSVAEVWNGTSTGLWVATIVRREGAG